MAKKQYIIAQPFKVGNGFTYMEDYGGYLQSCVSSIEDTQTYSFAEVAALKEKHEAQWSLNRLKVFEVIQALGKEIPLP